MAKAYEQLSLIRKDEPEFGAYAPNLMQSALISLIRIPPLHRGVLRRRMANLVRWLGRDSTVDIVRDELSYRLRPSINLIDDALLVHPAYNRTEIDFLRDGTPTGGVFVDLGANIGLYTLPLAKKVGPQGKVLAIDANPDIVGALDYNVKASGLKHVTIACVAAGDVEGKVKLQIRNADLAIVNVTDDSRGEIAMLPLARIVDDAGITHIDTMKADIEGFEDRAIPPMLNARPDLHPRRISIEHLGRKHWRTDCISEFKKHGYRLVGVTRGNSMFEKASVA